MDLKTVTYLVYLAISIGLTVWVARTLHRNGRIFLVDVFRGNEALADSVNHLLVVGFYLREEPIWTNYGADTRIRRTVDNE
jgi:hypothetical protein